MPEGRPPPPFIEFQFPKLVASAPTGDDWIHEVKYDGYRMQIRVVAGEVSIRTRRGHDWTDRFPRLVRSAAKLKDCVLDGEMCAVDKDGNPDFANLISSLKRNTDHLVFFAFDVLWLGREDMRRRDQITRKLALAKAIERAGPGIHYSAHTVGGGPALFAAACKRSLEGIVSKRASATYVAGKGGAWLKTKCRPGMEVVIGGWTTSGSASFKSILAGAYEGGKLRYIGKVGTGFSARILDDLAPRLRKLEIERSPFAGRQPTSSEKMRFVRPELVAEIAFESWTADALLRQASFKGLRADKPADTVAVERAVT